MSPWSCLHGQFQQIGSLILLLITALLELLIGLWSPNEMHFYDSEIWAGTLCCFCVLPTTRNRLTPALHTHWEGIHPAAGAAHHASPPQMQLSYAAIALRRGQLGILIRGKKTQDLLILQAVLRREGCICSQWKSATCRLDFVFLSYFCC